MLLLAGASLGTVSDADFGLAWLLRVASLLGSDGDTTFLVTLDTNGLKAGERMSKT